MDQTLPNQQQYPTQPVEQQPPIPINGSKNKVGFGILFIIIVIIFLTGILNYFNILKLSEIFPNQLGFLPHRPYYEQPLVKETPTPKQPISTAIVPTAESAKKVLVEALPNILVASLVPDHSEIVVKPDKHLQQILKESWQTDQGTISATLFTLPNGKNIASLDLFITKEENVSPSSELAKTATSKVFVITPKGTWGCKPLYERTYCENFWEDENGIRRGTVMDGPIILGSGKRLSSYSYCEHHKENLGLYSWKSCRAEFAKTGVTP